MSGIRPDEEPANYGFRVEFKPSSGSGDSDSSQETASGGGASVEQTETTTGRERQSAYLPTHELGHATLNTLDEYVEPGLPAAGGGGNSGSWLLLLVAALLLLGLISAGALMFLSVLPAGQGTTAPSASVTAMPTATLQPTATATLAPTATATTPATAPVQPKPPHLSVSTTQTTAFCANGNYPLITVKNTGGQTLHWTATGPANPPVTVSPASGNVVPGAAQSVTITGSHPGPTVSIQFAGNGGSVTLAFTCQ